jgi:outer membrane receptor protein involved in Fe transport
VHAGNYTEENEDDYRYSFLWFGEPALNIFGGDPIFEYTDIRDLSQTAAFGEVTWEILPDLTLTGGARVYQYDRTTEIEQGGAVIGPTPTYEKISADKSGSTFRANLSYKPTDDSLVYAAWSQGFRLGKPQAGVPVQLCDTDLDGLIDGTNVSVDSTRDVNSDSVDSYEVGGKFTGFGRRLSVTTAVFRMDWADIPVSVQYPSCAYITTANAGKARSEGIELAANLRITDNLLMDIGGSWVDAKLTQDVPLQGLSDGDELPGAPKYNFSMGIENRFALFDRPSSIRVDAIYLGSFYSALPATPEQKAGDYVELNASARMEFERLNVALFARNLTNEDAFINRAGAIGQFDGSRMRPRTIGVRLGYQF